MEQAQDRVGRVVAACSSPNSGIPKEPKDEVKVGPLGIVGDYHSGPVDKHFRRGRARPNERHLTVVAREATAAAAVEIDAPIEPGDLGENFLVEGLGDLGDLRPGDRLRFGETVLIEVTSQNKPCATLRPLGHGIERALKRRRGVTAVVRQPGVVRPGDPVRVLRAEPVDFGSA